MRLVVKVAVLFIFLFGITSVCFAVDDIKENQFMELTLERAIKRALGFSNSLERAKLELEDAKDARINVSEDYYTGKVDEALPYVYLAETTHFAYEKAKRSYQLERDSIILDVYEKYYEVLRKQEELKAKQAALEKAEQELKVARASYMAGMVSKMAVDAAEINVVSKKTEVASAQADLDNAYAALNQLVGLSEGDRPVLVDIPDFEPVVTDLDIYMHRVLDDSPALWTAEEAAEYMKKIKNMNPPEGYGLQKVTDEDAEKAELDADSARDATRLLVRTLYNSVKKLEEAYRAAQKGVEVAEENLRITKVKFDVGMATKTDLIKSEADLTEAKQKMFDLMYRHAFMKKVLEKPWAYSV